MLIKWYNIHITFQKWGIDMLKVLDAVLLSGGAIFCLLIFTAFALMLVQARWPAIEEKLEYFFNTKIGMTILLWGAIGASYTVAFY